MGDTVEYSVRMVPGDSVEIKLGEDKLAAVALSLRESPDGPMVVLDPLPGFRLEGEEPCAYRVVEEIQAEAISAAEIAADTIYGEPREDPIQEALDSLEHLGARRPANEHVEDRYPIEIPLGAGRGWLAIDLWGELWRLRQFGPMGNELASYSGIPGEELIEACARWIQTAEERL